jgi:high-affinity nickel permease
MPSSTLQIALLSAAILGFRHGFDYDHIAALSDIVSVFLLAAELGGISKGFLSLGMFLFGSSSLLAASRLKGAKPFPWPEGLR